MSEGPSGDQAVAAPAEELAALKLSEDIPQASTPNPVEKPEAAGSEASAPVPPHRSHDPVYSQKRSDPFQFGSRFLEAGDDPFEFNAWDHVETDDAYKEHAEAQIEKQRQSPVSDFDKSTSIFPLPPTWLTSVMIPKPNA